MLQRPINLFRLSKIRFSTTLCTSDVGERPWVIVIHFRGSYGHGSAGNPDGRFMAGIVAAVCATWSPSGVILDLRQLEYEFGNTIIGALGAGRPIRIIVSEKCEKGIKGILRGDSSHLISSSIEDAYEQIRSVVGSK